MHIHHATTVAQIRDELSQFERLDHYVSERALNGRFRFIIWYKIYHWWSLEVANVRWRLWSWSKELGHLITSVFAEYAVSNTWWPEVICSSFTSNNLTSSNGAYLIVGDGQIFLTGVRTLLWITNSTLLTNTTQCTWQLICYARFIELSFPTDFRCAW